MKWTIDRISPNEDSIYLVNRATGSVRQVSVPGAEDAWFRGAVLVIRAKTGFLWEVDPDNGSRRRLMAQQDFL